MVATARNIGSGITAFDGFCGAGGSTTGLKAAGIEVLHAANHWQLAINSHNTNHQEVNHTCADLTGTHPGWFPKTTIAWFSPMCTTHSPAGGNKRRTNQLHLWENAPPDPGVERSRMTAWDVVTFSEYHRYVAVVVENVIEFATGWELFDEWLGAMLKLGYQHQIVCFNSMFAYPNPVPQSRDRLYVVFHRKGNKAPNVNFTPPAICPEHGEVRAIQSWKNTPLGRRKIGKYGRQYVFTCPCCAQEVVPYRRAAKEAIDWSLKATRIGDRAHLGKKALSDSTLRRIEAGLKRFTVPWLIKQVYTSGDELRSSGVDAPVPTLTTKRELSLVSPPFLIHYGHSTEPEDMRVRSLEEVAPTVTCSRKLYLAFIATNRRNTEATDIEQPTSTVTTRGQHVVIESPPFLTAYHGGRDAVHEAESPAPTIATNKQISMVQPPPFLSSYYGNGGSSSIEEAAPTVRAGQGQALIEPDWSALVQECRYRMIKAHEAKWLMGFPTDYIILGTQDQQFKQAGNAVTPEVATMIGRAIVESLS